MISNLTDTTPQNTDVARIHAAQRGDLDAFNELVTAYQGRAYNLAYRIMGEAAGAADATQEAFIAAYRNIQAFREGNFVAWLLRIVTNTCYDELRRRKRRPSESLDMAGSELRFTADIESPEQAAQRADLNRVIQGCLNDLPEEMRAAVVLCDVQGYDYQEIADIMTSSLGTVKSRISRARGKLRDCLSAFRELLPSG